MGNNMNKFLKILGWIIIIGVIIFSFILGRVNIVELIGGLPATWLLLQDMFPPKFSIIPKLLPLCLETVEIGIVGTLLGSFLSLPLGFLSAKNTSPHPIVYNATKLIIGIFRSIPEIIYGLILVISMGMGSLPGILTLVFGTIGLASKFYAESLEAIDFNPVEAVESTGSYKIHTIVHSVVPQIIPLFTSYSLYILDHNIRVAIGLGIIGAGGIGVELFIRMRTFRYQEAMAILLTVLLLLIIVDRISAYMRKRIIDGDFLKSKPKVLDFSALFVIGLLTIYSLFRFFSNFETFKKGIPLGFSLISKMFPPNFTYLKDLVVALSENISMGVVGTIVAIIISLFLGFFSARNIINFKPITFILSQIQTFLRAIPDVVFGLIFVAAVGLGPFAGIIALGIHSAGLLSKFYGETIENIDFKSVEAVKATGANIVQTIRHAVFPQITPLFNSYNLFLFDRNLRESTALGIVGAGGIGYEITISMRMGNFEKASAAIILIVILVILVDYFSTNMRKKILE